MRPFFLRLPFGPGWDLALSLYVVCTRDPSGFWGRRRTFEGDEDGTSTLQDFVLSGINAGDQGGA